MHGFHCEDTEGTENKRPVEIRIALLPKPINPDKLLEKLKN